jgi:protein-S-isoprenylcysteine O-methyltransferase Ste14
MIPRRGRRRSALERGVVRVIATGGVVGISVGIAAILASSNVQGWIIGLVVSLVSVVLAAVLWSSRQV